MKARLLPLLILVLALAVVGAAAPAGASTRSQTVKVARLVPVESHVTGFVFLRQRHEGGTSAFVIAFGLVPGQQYTSFYYDDNECMEGPEEVGTFEANALGIGVTSAIIDDDLDEIGSISVRAPDYSVLYSCAHLFSGPGILFPPTV